MINLAVWFIGYPVSEMKFRFDMSKAFSTHLHNNKQFSESQFHTKNLSERGSSYFTVVQTLPSTFKP